MSFKLTGQQNSEKNKTEVSQNKVLHLDTRLTRRVQMKNDIHQKKGALLASVVSLIALVSIVNQSLISKNKSEELNRQVASANGEAQLKAWKQDLLKDLSNKKNRGLASYGEFPTPLEQLRMGALEGKYSFSIKDNGVEEIKFIESAEGDRPKSIRNYLEFVTEHKKAFNANIEKVEKPEEKILKNTKGEVEKLLTFKTLGVQDQSLGKIVVLSDSASRLILVKYEK